MRAGRSPAIQRILQPVVEVAVEASFTHVSGPNSEGDHCMSRSFGSGFTAFLYIGAVERSENRIEIQLRVGVQSHAAYALLQELSGQERNPRDCIADVSAEELLPKDRRGRTVYDRYVVPRSGPTPEVIERVRQDLGTWVVPALKASSSNEALLSDVMTMGIQVPTRQVWAPVLLALTGRAEEAVSLMEQALRGCREGSWRRNYAEYYTRLAERFLPDGAARAQTFLLAPPPENKFRLISGRGRPGRPGRGRQ